MRLPSDLTPRGSLLGNRERMLCAEPKTSAAYPVPPSPDTNGGCEVRLTWWRESPLARQAAERRLLYGTSPCHSIRLIDDAQPNMIMRVRAPSAGVPL